MSQSTARGRHAYPIVVAIAIVAGVALRWPAVDAGVGSDDYMQYATLDGKYPVARSSLDLFSFSDGSDEERQALMDSGAMPWWTAPGLRLAMLRPVASALVILDRSVLGDSAWLHHLHTFAWWALLVVVVAALLRRLLPEPVAALAVVLFVCEEGHGTPVVWLANRGALVALVFGFGGLNYHLRHRLDGDRRALVLSVVCYAMGLLSGEWVFPVFGYLIAFELLAATGSLAQRVLALTPAGALAVAFLAVRSRLRYGALNSGVYIDPVTEPWHYLVAASQRIPVFFADLVFSIPAVQYSFGTPWRDRVLGWRLFSPEVWAQLPEWRTWHVAIGVSAMILLAWAVRASLSAGNASGRRANLRWLLLGSLLSMLPVVASFPSSRLVMPASIGIFATLAAAASHWLAQVRARWLEARRLAGWSLVGLGLVGYLQLWEAPVTSRRLVEFMGAQYGAVADWVREADLDDRTLADEHLFVMSTTEHTLAFFLPFVLHYQGRPMPLSSRTLSGAMIPHDVERTATNVLEMTALTAGFGTNAMEQLYRDRRFGWRIGDRVALKGLDVEVLQLLGGYPRRVRFTFDRDVDDPSLRFLEVTPKGIQRFRVPSVGETVRLKRAAFPIPGAMESVVAMRDPNVTCVGQRPLIDDCVLGQAHADCGGEGAPVFACHGFGDCRWFAGGCVAHGYVASHCTADDACCQDGWPYVDFETFERGIGSLGIEALLHGWGREAWDGSREANVIAMIEPGLAEELATAVPRVECAGGGGPCDGGRVLPLGYYPHSFSLAFESPAGRADWGLTVDVVEDRRRGLVARVCRVSPPPRFDGACPPSPPPTCATEGVLRIDRLPHSPAEVGHVRVDLLARFTDGEEIAARF